jgi:membrane fusion protein, multidrug efflux system
MTSRPPLAGKRGVWIGAAAVVAAGALWYASGGGGSPPPMAMPASPVVVAKPLMREIVEWDDYVGRFRASQTVEVRPRVPGQIDGIDFKDGEFVEKGQLLFTIDKRRFLDGQKAAQADLESAKSSLLLANLELQRGQYLVDKNTATIASLDQLKARAQAATASVDSAEARLRDRDLDIEFSEVRAPVTGRVSDHRVDIGNEVAGAEGNSGTLLTTILSLDPLYFDFDASEALFLKAQRLRQTTGTAPEVQIRLQDESGYTHKGRIDFTDNTLNPRSGTIRGRATVPNPSRFLRPGLFGYMRMATGEKSKALLVPDAAVQTDQARKIVLVLGDNDTVSAKEVVPGALVDGLRVIRSGLADTDRVVIEGIGAAPGAKVAPKDGKFEPLTSAGPTHVEPPPAAEATIVP